MKIYEQKRNNLKEGDLLELGKLLLKAGYVVRLGREKKGSQYTQNVEFWTAEGGTNHEE